MTIEVTYDKIVAKLHEAVANRGADYVYDPGDTSYCRNWHNDTNTPGCIVGYVYHSLGIGGDILAVNPSRIATTLTADLVTDGLIRFPNQKEEGRVARLLFAAQNAQDNLVPWGSAVQDALEAVDA